jgi:hypothetical protein
MESSLVLPTGIIVDKNKNSYYFYYKPITNNSAKKTTLKRRKYKCFLQVSIYSPQHIHIHEFDCKGRGKGEGKILLCAALNYLKTELGLKDDAIISLTAITVEKTNPRENQDKLIGYYKRTYGFEVIKEDQVADMYRTDMSTTIKTAIEKCSISTVKQNKSMLQKISNFVRSLKKSRT